MARQSPLGTLLAERRLPPRPGRIPGPPPAPRAARHVLPVPDLELKPVEARSPASLRLLSVSILLHAGLAAAVVVVPLLMRESLPVPASGVRVFFAEPLALPAPPPPPAPASRAPRAQKAPPPSPRLTAPVEVPERVVPEEAADPTAPGTESAGVEGGVPGGVVGGIVEALPEPPAPPQVVHVGGAIREPTKVKHVNPVYPDVAARAMVQGNVVVELQVNTQGRVTDAQVVKGIPLLNEAALAAVRQWVYTPPLVDGVPVRLIMTVTVRFKLT
jgi:periplasmic protein TonB